MNVLVAGGTGFVGRRVCAALAARGDVVTVVSRDPAAARRRTQPVPPGISHRGWLPELDAYDAIVNLAGEPIFGPRWNAERKAALRASRVDSTRRIVDAIGAATEPPTVLVNASAIGYYGDRGAEPLPETAAPGDDLMAGICAAWEAEARRSPVRTAILRLGVVLGPDGGALAQMLPPFRLGLGGPIGLGRNHFSWVHLDDVVGLVLLALDDDSISGPVNATSPGVVTNAAFSRALGRALHRPAIFPVPPFALRVLFGEVAQVLTASQNCVPEAARRSGYAFRFPEIEPALRDVLAA
jgi:hypothetical protein